MAAFKQARECRHKKCSRGDKFPQRFLHAFIKPEDEYVERSAHCQVKTAALGRAANHIAEPFFGKADKWPAPLS